MLGGETGKGTVVLDVLSLRILDISWIHYEGFGEMTWQQMIWELSP